MEVTQYDDALGRRCPFLLYKESRTHAVSGPAERGPYRSWGWGPGRYLRTRGSKLGAHELRALDHCFQFLERHLARQVLHPAVGRDDDVFRRDERQGAADARRYFPRRLHRHVVEVDHAEDDRFSG